MADNNTCNESDKLANFAKSIIKSFILLTVVISLIYIKTKYLKSETGQPPIINTILFILLGTVLLTILGITDMYIFNNVMLGLGIAVGMHFFNS
jgi:hypothetical protein